jgi:acetolactate synthase I/II/III large subunit
MSKSGTGSDPQTGAADRDVLTPVAPERLGPADAEAIAAATLLINGAKKPLLLLGLLASQPRAAETVRALLAKHVRQTRRE